MRLHDEADQNGGERRPRSLSRQRVRHTSTVGKVKIVFSGWHPYAIWLLRALSFDGKLCLRHGRNAAFLG